MFGTLYDIRAGGWHNVAAVERYTAHVGVFIVITIIIIIMAIVTTARVHGHNVKIHGIWRQKYNNNYNKIEGKTGRILARAAAASEGEEMERQTHC